MYCNVGWCIKGSAVRHRHQQCFVAEWLGLSVTIRVRARARGWDFPFFFLSMLKVTNTFVLHVRGSCGVHGLRTTTVHDVMIMYYRERYMENVPKDNCYWSRHSHESISTDMEFLNWLYWTMDLNTWVKSFQNSWENNQRWHNHQQSFVASKQWGGWACSKTVEGEWPIAVLKSNLLADRKDLVHWSYLWDVNCGLQSWLTCFKSSRQYTCSWKLWSYCSRWGRPSTIRRNIRTNKAVEMLFHNQSDQHSQLKYAMEQIDVIS